MELNDAQLERYRRNILLEDIGIEGQQRLLDSRVLVIGAGGLGSPVIMYLTATGVGHITVCDADTVDLSNLQRQIIHNMDMLNVIKVDSVRRYISRLNSDVSLTTISKMVTNENIFEIIEDHDFIIDATDNFASKFLINDACVSKGKPYSHGGINGFSGQSLTVIPGSSCYRCVYPEDIEEDNGRKDLGVLGAVAGVIGSIQATECIKYLSGERQNEQLLINRLLVFDGIAMKFKDLKVKKNASCPSCSGL